MVDDVDNDLAVLRAHRDANVAPVRAELDRVVDEVDEDLTEARIVGTDRRDARLRRPPASVTALRSANRRSRSTDASASRPYVDVLRQGRAVPRPRSARGRAARSPSARGGPSRPRSWRSAPASAPARRSRAASRASVSARRLTVDRGVRSSWLRLSMNSERICWRRRSSVASSRMTRTPVGWGRCTWTTRIRGSPSPTRSSPVAEPPTGTPSISSSARGSRKASMTVGPGRRPGFAPRRACARSLARSIRRAASRRRTPTGSRASRVPTARGGLVGDPLGLGPRLDPRPARGVEAQRRDVVGAALDDVERREERDREPRHRDRQHAVHVARIAYAGRGVRRL